jgi:hypothetical protein
MKSRVFGLGVALLSGAAEAGVIYDSTGSSPETSPVLNLAYHAIADELVLAPGPRLLDGVGFEYYGEQLDGDERVIVRIHALDGNPSPGSFGFATPKSVLWSVEVPVSNTGDATGMAWAATPSVLLPDVIIVSLEPTGGFDGQDDTWRPLLKDPLPPASSFSDIWRLGDDGDGLQWALFNAGGNPNLNLALKVTAVPDAGSPSAWDLVASCLFLVAWRRLRRAD